MRRVALLFNIVLVWAVALAACSTASASTPNYLDFAKQGMTHAKQHYWNSQENWWNDSLDPNTADYWTGHQVGVGVHIPLATVWPSASAVFETLDGIALAEPTKANKRAVGSFAKYADTRYWNGELMHHGGWSPYPGDRGWDACAFYDDNNWFGLGFLDAYRATHNKRFLDDARKTSDFVNDAGWEGGGVNKGMRWNTWHGDVNVCRHTYSLEALAGATALAAGIYERSGNTTYRDRAKTYLAWAKKYAFDSGSTFYENVGRVPSNVEQPPMTYVEGTMIAAHLSLCRGYHGKGGDPAACKRARAIAQASFYQWGPGDPNWRSDADTILLRYIVQWAQYDKDQQLWDWAANAAARARNRARPGNQSDLYLLLWNGKVPVNDWRSPDYNGDMHYGQIGTHAASTSLFAWLAAYPRPKGTPSQPGAGYTGDPYSRCFLTSNGRRVCK